MKRHAARYLSYALAVAVSLLVSGTASAVVLDTFQEDFDSRTADATINGQELWSVTEGSTSSAVVQSSTTPKGSGKALKLASASTPVTVVRSATYGGLTPTWVTFLARPGLGSERRANPSSGIAAITFDPTGKIMASDGTTWVDTGQTFTTDKWWEVIQKLNFTTHTYDLYISPVGTPKVSFTPVKTGLNFIDATKNSLGTVQFNGVYNATTSTDAFFDNFSVTYIERIEFISPAQTMVQDQISGPITVQLQSSVREPQRAVEDLFFQLKTTSATGKFSLQVSPWQDATQMILLKNATSAAFYYKDSTVGKPSLSVKEFPDRGWLEGLQQQQVILKASHFEVLATSPQTAGTPFSVTIYARTDEGLTDETYSGTVTLAAAYVNPATGTMQLTPTQASGFAKGKLNLTVAYPDAGVIVVRVTDVQDSSKTGTSGQLVILPAKFQVGADASQVVNRSFTLTVTALNVAGAVTPNYQSAVNLGVQAVAPATGAGGLIPVTLAASSFQSGKASVQATYPRWGTISVSATDAASPTVVGQSGSLAFHPSTIQVQATLPPPPRDFFYTGEPFSVKVSALDAAGVAIPSYLGTVALSASSALGLPQTYTFVAADGGVHTFSVVVGAPGTYQAQATESAGGIISPSLSITVKQAMLKVVSTVAPVGPATEVTILLLDSAGQVITSESSATITVKLIEDLANQSVSSPALSQTVKITQGKATFLISNTEAETVTVVPAFPFGLNVQPGTVSFGRFSTKGVGVLLWNEVREETP